MSIAYASESLQTLKIYTHTRSRPSPQPESNQEMAMDISWYENPYFLLFGVLMSLLLVLAARVFLVLRNTGKPISPVSSQRPLHTLFVLGSGGHTAEMLSLVGALNLQRYAPRYYIAAVTDSMSLTRAATLEDHLQKCTPSTSSSSQAAESSTQKPKFYQVYRSREVGQSYFTSVVTTLLAMVHALWLVARIRPDVILCNGPGTCLPICMAGFLLKVVGVKWVVIVYVESIARVKKLSLTGLLLYKLGVSDQFFVQWSQLKDRFPNTIYTGRLM
jgi:beta-1,4-N-acetylglucosaminyltransferase